jgi:hypothetical protein
MIGDWETMIPIDKAIWNSIYESIEPQDRLSQLGQLIQDTYTKSIKSSVVADSQATQSFDKSLRILKARENLNIVLKALEGWSIWVIWRLLNLIAIIILLLRDE